MMLSDWWSRHVNTAYSYDLRLNWDHSCCCRFTAEHGASSKKIQNTLRVASVPGWPDTFAQRLSLCNIWTRRLQWTVPERAPLTRVSHQIRGNSQRRKCLRSLRKKNKQRVLIRAKKEKKTWAISRQDFSLCHVTCVTLSSSGARAWSLCVRTRMALSIQGFRQRLLSMGLGCFASALLCVWFMFLHCRPTSRWCEEAATLRRPLPTATMHHYL